MATLPARAHLEALLRSRKLDGTLTPVHRATPPADPWDVAIPTGQAALDRRMDGGFPRGHLSEIVGPCSSGRTSVLAAVMASATRRGELAALVDTLDGFDPESAAGAGLVLERLLWVRGGAAAGAARAAAVDRALKATNLLLQSGDFALVALDLADVTPRELQRIPFTTWPRLQRVVEASRTVCLVVAAAHVARSAGGLTLALDTARGPRFSGGLAHARVLEDLEVTARVRWARAAGAEPMAIRVGMVPYEA